MNDPFEPPLSSAELEEAVSTVRLLEPLKAGGQGQTFKVKVGERRSLGVLKVYHPGTTVLRVEREIDKLERLDSPHVVGLIGHGEIRVRDQVCLYAIMDYVEGQEVSGLVGSLSDERIDSELRHLLCDVGQAIEDLWHVRVVHRDIKPANLIRRSDGHYTVLDLGLAKHLDASTITLLGMVCGTFGYMSPEQATGRRSLTFRSDLFSLGLVAYEVALGRHPFARRQEHIGQVTLKPLNDEVPAVSSPVSDIVGQLLQVEPLRRARQPSEILQKLAEGT